MSSESPTHRSGTDAVTTATTWRAKLPIFWLLGLGLALRLAHVSSELSSPLSYQLAPDEGYYLEFGKAVSGGHGADYPEQLALDPGYGYLLGALFRLFGVNVFAVYVIQALLDTATIYGIVLVGRQLGRERAGVFGAVIYATTSAAIMYGAALLKEVWVSSFVIWWTAGALALLGTRRRAPWAAFGLYCGLGVALRANLVLLSLGALALPTLARHPPPSERGATSRSLQAALLIVGLTAALAPWALRNAGAKAGFTPLPLNGGISLHQVYNADNPRGEFWIPPFVDYMNPGEIWRGYAAEAGARAGRPLGPAAVDRYWRGQAMDYIARHPAAVVSTMLRKALVFLSSAEIPDNRSTYEEGLFSPVIRILPRMTVVLVALGLTGLATLGWRRAPPAQVGWRRWLIVSLPVVATWVTVAVFFDADRFRFHAAPLLALCAGVWIDTTLRLAWQRRAGAALGLVVLAAGLAACSLALGAGQPPPAVRWDQIGWGYLKMGRPGEARRVAERALAQNPDDGNLWEVMGFAAIERNDMAEARRDYRRAVELRPRSHVAHFNLARIYFLEGDRPRAADEIRSAIALDPLPEYQALLSRIERGD